MNVDSGVVNIGYSSTYTGSKGTSISLEQVRRILGDHEGIMELAPRFGSNLKRLSILGDLLNSGLRKVI